MALSKPVVKPTDRTKGIGMVDGQGRAATTSVIDKYDPTKDGSSVYNNPKFTNASSYVRPPAYVPPPPPPPGTNSANKPPGAGNDPNANMGTKTYGTKPQGTYNPTGPYTGPGQKSGIPGPEGGLDANGVWHPPTEEYLAGLANGTIAPKWAGQPGSPEYQGWLNWKASQPANPGPNAPAPPGGGGGGQSDQNPAGGAGGGGGVGTGQGGGAGGGGGVPAGQVSQQAAQALYNDNTIPHEFKNQLMEIAKTGNALAFNQALFGSNIPQATKMLLQQLFGFGGPAGGGNGGPQSQVQDQNNQTPPPAPVTPPIAPPNPRPIIPPNPGGSQYYGAF